jgi:hypothetical protein
MQCTNFKQSKTSTFTPVFLLFLSIVLLSRGTANGLIIMKSFRSKILDVALKIN